jgi:Phage portal protein/Phage Mu protein F like protein
MTASNRNNSGKDFDPGIVFRVAGAIRYAFTGQTPEWFSPLKPIAPVAPPEVAGRQFDFTPGYNLNTRPRNEEAVSFSQMRALADSLDILRLVIESRKDQIDAQKFQFQLKGDSKAKDSRCEMLTEFFAQPDKEHTWSDWLRMLMEDMFVLDAPTIYPRKTKGGQIYGFEIVDGSTIKRVIDDYGRTPLPPEAAYQQILKGVPAVNYTRDELIYKPRNPRSNRVYGYSPVEQIIMTVNIAIRRQLSQLSYYTDGSTPDLIFAVPKEWNPDQIRSFKNWWDETLNGNLKARRGTMFVPEGVDPVNTKDALLTDKYDEWLARIICYAFSISPQPFINQINRATAETAQEVAVQEGLLPLMNWVRDLMNLLIVKYFGFTDIEFSWTKEEELDPLVKAQVAQIYLGAKVVTADEVRANDLGMNPLTPEQKAELSPPMPDQLLGDEDGEEPGKKPQAPAIKALKIKPINRNRKAIVKQRTLLEKVIKAALQSTLKAVIAQVTKSETVSITKDKKDDERKIIMKELDELDISSNLEAMTAEGVAAAFSQLAINNDDALNQAHEKAIAWAKKRAAELVGKKIDANGNWIDNQNAKYRISDSTRDAIRSIITQAEEQGWSNDQLAVALSDSFAFSDERAELIARTETAFADTNGNMIAYRESGVVSGKRWILDADACEICQANADAGVIPLDDDFPDGSDTAPAHPRCECDVVPELTDED